MKRFALSFLVILGLVGCGTMRPTASYEVDISKVAAIERAATTQGVQVYWVNKPVKLAAAGS